LVYVKVIGTPFILAITKVHTKTHRRLLDEDLQAEIPAPYCSFTEHTLPVTDVSCGIGLFPSCRIFTASLDHSVKVCVKRCIRVLITEKPRCRYGTSRRAPYFLPFSFHNRSLFSPWTLQNAFFSRDHKMGRYTRLIYSGSEQMARICEESKLLVEEG
jgi:hypothetical protein